MFIGYLVWKSKLKKYEPLHNFKIKIFNLKMKIFLHLYSWVIKIKIIFKCVYLTKKKCKLIISYELH